MSRERFMHRVPEYDEDGNVTGTRYFGTATAAKDFAKNQAWDLGHGGWMMESLPRDLVEELLTDHVPVPDHFRPRGSKDLG